MTLLANHVCFVLFFSLWCAVTEGRFIDKIEVSAPGTIPRVKVRKRDRAKRRRACARGTIDDVSESVTIRLPCRTFHAGVQGARRYFLVCLKGREEDKKRTSIQCLPNMHNRDARHG